VLLCVQIKKPIIEKRRRERINDCLNQLKALVLEATQKDVRRVSFYATVGQGTWIRYASV